jgi:hypothetical protein
MSTSHIAFRSWRHMMGRAILAGLVTGLAATRSPADDGSPPEGSLEAMRALAEATQVTVATDEGETQAELKREPVFRYSDQVRGILDGTLWAWTVDGAPVAFQKIEDLNSPLGGERRWTYCFTSVTAASVRVAWRDRDDFATRALPGRFQRLPEAPELAAAGPSRSRQFRAIARQFACTIQNDPVADNREEMRLLTRPLLEYECPELGVLAGAVFGMAFGTNPDLLLVIEVDSSAAGDPEWRFAAARMTTGGLRLRWQEREVWADEWVHPTPKPFDTWTFFFVPRDEE